MLIHYPTVLVDTSLHLTSYGLINYIHYFGKLSKIIDLHHRITKHKIMLDWELVDMFDSNNDTKVYGLDIEIDYFVDTSFNYTFLCWEFMFMDLLHELPQNANSNTWM